MLISARHVATARVAWGAVLLLSPRPVLVRVHRLPVDRRTLVVARVLGVRQVAQGAMSLARPDPAVLVSGVLVDALHAASMLGLAAVDRRRTRGAVTEAALAAAWGVLGWRTLPAREVP